MIWLVWTESVSRAITRGRARLQAGGASTGRPATCQKKATRRSASIGPTSSIVSPWAAARSSGVVRGFFARLLGSTAQLR